MASRPFSTSIHTTIRFSSMSCVMTSLDIDARKVRIERVNTQAVIDNDGVSREKQIFRQNNAAAIRCLDRRTGLCAEVRSRMRRAGLAVKNPPVSEIGAGLAGYGNTER